MTRIGARPQVSIALQSNKRPAEYLDLAAAVEAAGFDGISIFSDLGFQPPWQALALIAAHTSRVRVGPACVNPFTTHPVDIAGHAALLDLVADGRTYLGVTKGTWLGQVRVHQPDVPAALADTAVIVAKLLAGETDGHRGAAFALEPGFAFRFPIARPRIPLLIGAWGPKAVAVAGEHADELKVGGTANPDLVAVMRERLEVGTRRAGRSAHDVDLVFGAVTVVDDDGEAARRLARTEVAMYLAVLAGLDPTVDVDPGLVATIVDHVDHQRHEQAGALISDELLECFAFAGTPEQVAEQALRLFAAGVDRVEFGTPHGIDSRRGIELLGSRVLPALGRSR